MDRRVTPPKRVTSPTWGPPPLCKQALRVINILEWAPRCLRTEHWIEIPRLYREIAICGGKC